MPVRRSIERQVARLSAADIVETERAIGWGAQVVAPNAATRITLRVDGRKCSTNIFQNPSGSGPRPIQRQMILLAGVVSLQIYVKFLETRIEGNESVVAHCPHV